MASALMATPAFRASFFQLPPHLRAAAFRQTTSILPGTPSTLRSFSASPARKAKAASMEGVGAATSPAAEAATTSFSNLILAPPTFLLDSIHALGLPWWAALPATAFAVRALLLYPLVSLPARMRAMTQSNLVPLANARSVFKVNFAQVASRERMDRRTEDTERFNRWARMWRRVYHMQRELHRIGKRFNSPRFTWQWPLPFLTLIWFMEALRVKCGAGRGLFGMLSGAAQRTKLAPWIDPEVLARRTLESELLMVGGVKRVDPDTVTALVAVKNEAKEAIQTGEPAALFDQLQAPDFNREAYMMERLAEYYKIKQEAVGIFPITPTAESTLETAIESAPADLTTTLTSKFDPSMQLEGIPWWTLDLTTPDTTIFLPLCLGLTIAGSGFIPRIRAAFGASDLSLHGHEQQKKSNGALGFLNIAEKVQLGIGGIMFLVALKVPAAILMYWIPSIISAQVIKFYMDWRYPVPKPLAPCSRPLRMNMRKEVNQ